MSDARTSLNASRSPAKLLAAAKNVAGDRAVEAAGRQDFRRSREWQALAAEIDRVLRDAVELMARG